MLIIEVGKTYKKRNGDVVKITQNNRCFIYSFMDESSNIYTKEGRRYTYELSSEDLVEEVVDK